jgi:isopentenyl-diphosphate delta-isomerase
MEQRKADHIGMAFNARTDASMADPRFNYEPLTGIHPSEKEECIPFLGKKLRLPMWVSSMTGGTKEARTINTNLARACNEFGMGMGLGSCRILLDHPEYMDDFNVRPVIGPDLPLFANIGIVQLQEMLTAGTTGRLEELVGKLQADGLIVHVNPMQEWLQVEGDRITVPPAETISRFLSLTNMQVIVKEVGQGMGPESIRVLLSMPIAAFELAAFGGTNFAMLELARKGGASGGLSPLAYAGHTAHEMVEIINTLPETSCRQLIISGGIRNFLDGYYLVSLSRIPALFGMASSFLKYARGEYSELQAFVSEQADGYRFASSFLTIRH